MRKIADNPYPGSRTFTQADKDFFFGRDADIAVIVDYWTTNRLTVVSGAPGCGKTSLLHAGVRPLLREQTAQYQPRIFSPGNLSRGMTFPFPALTEHNPFTLALLRSWAPDDVPARLAGLSVSVFVREQTREHDGVTYAAVDALDDLVLDPESGVWKKWSQEFLAELAEAMSDHPSLHLLLVTRIAGLSLLNSSVLTSFAGFGARHTITGLTPLEAIAAIRKPAMAAGRTFADTAAHGIVTDLLRISQEAELPSDRPVEPSLIQAVCSRLWKEVPQGVTDISDQTIREFGDSELALADYCGQVITDTAALHRIPPRMLRAWLVTSLIMNGNDCGGLHEGTTTADKIPNPVLRDLLDRHLLTGPIEKSGQCYRLDPRLMDPLRMASVPAAVAATAVSLLRAAELALTRGEFDLAWEYAERARDALPEQELRDAPGFRARAEAESLLGNVACRRGEPAGAVPHYRKASELMQAAGDSHAAAYQLAAAGQLLLAGEDPGDAIPELSAAADRERGDLGLQIRLAFALWQTGDGRGAVMILSSVIDRDGGLAEARRMRGEVLADLGEGDRAISDLDHAAPDVPSSQAARGLALAQTGDHSAAAAEINGALARARRSGLALLYAARVSDLAGDNVSAKDRAREAIDANDPPLSPAHKQVARALAGRREKHTGPYPVCC